MFLKMDEQENVLSESILRTPQPSACSTAKIDRHLKPLTQSDHSFDANSLSYLADKNLSIGQVKLDQQRRLASNSLLRAQKVSAIPSKYLKPNLSVNDSCSSSLGVLSDGTISDSDLLKTPKNTSTPRPSAESEVSFPNVSDVNASRQSTRLSLQNLKALSEKLRSEIGLDDFMEEFNKATASAAAQYADIAVNSDMFVSGELAESKLYSDEMSWRNKNDLPMKDPKESILMQSVNDNPSTSKISMYFQQKSDTLADLQEAISPEKQKPPTPLIDMTLPTFQAEAKDNVVYELLEEKSLSTSLIAKLISNTDGTPGKLLNYFDNYLAKKGKSADTNECLEKLDPSDNSSELPISRNSSYTSNFSENDAINRCLSDKENRNTINIPNKKDDKRRTNSSSICSKQNAGILEPTSSMSSRPASSVSRSSSSLSTLPDGKLPIESTKYELIWGCVKVDKCLTQEFMLRNKSSKSLRLQCSVGSHDFKIKQDSDSVHTLKFVLRGFESRTIIVLFTPTRNGACKDEIAFTSLDPNLKPTKKQSVHLYGYGGYSNVIFHNIPKDRTGTNLLSLGKLEGNSIFRVNLEIKNSGNIPAFVRISFRAQKSYVSSNISIVPNFFILAPSEEREVLIIYSPSVNDYRTLHQALTSVNITSIGSLDIISGCEVNRFRLKRLHQKAVERGINVDPLVEVLNEHVSEEMQPVDIHKFKERLDSLTEILRLFNYDEIVLMVEQDLDQTIVPHFPDDSALYNTITQTSIVDDTVISNQRLCKLEPCTVLLSPPGKREDIICLFSEATKVVNFEAISQPSGLKIKPNAGQIAPGQPTIIKIQYTSEFAPRNFKVIISVESEKLEADVKVLPLNILTGNGNFLE